MFKKVLNKITNVICVAIIIICIAVLCIFCFGNKSSVFGFSAFNVLTGSMEPTIPTNSFIIVKAADPDELKEGDIISFYSTDPELRGQVNTHRIVGVSQDNTGAVCFITRGDANLIDDKYYTPGENVIGRVVLVSKLFGVIVRLLSNPVVFIPIIMIPLLIFLIGNIRNVVSMAKVLAAEEEKEALKAQLKEVKAKRAELEKEQYKE